MIRPSQPPKPIVAPRIRWTPRGIVVFDVPPAVLEAAREALADAGATAAEYQYRPSAGDEFQWLAIELEARGAKVAVEVDDRCRLRHCRCRVCPDYSVAEWFALPEKATAMMPCLDDTVEIPVSTRWLKCGSHVGYGSMELVENKE